MQGAPPTQMNTGNIHLAVVPSKSDLLEPRRKLKGESDDGDLLAPKLDDTVALPARPRSPPKFPRAPKHDSADLKPNDDDLMEWPLSLKTEDIKSLRVEICAQETDGESPKVEDKRVATHTKANMTPKELSTAEEVALQCADEFLRRLEHAVKRRYKDGTENDLMLWDDEIPSKKPKIEAAADDQDCEPGQEPVSNVDAFTPPCPVIATGTHSPGSEKFPSVQKLSQLFFDQMNNEPSVQFLFPSHAWEPAIQESRQSAMELWQAGLEIKTEDTCDDGQVVDRGGKENVSEAGLARD
ncbi:hypothetical protein EsDP_00000935 [Epichloe bromicola]|uniref:Uncharacterized protein n=1 Tax=Epichloe bromicola TaxID=79588 RepID=A0ABQ0CGD9_9HYPO